MSVKTTVFIVWGLEDETFGAVVQADFVSSDDPVIGTVRNVYWGKCGVGRNRNRNRKQCDALVVKVVKRK